jgi:hypothetical protein
MRGTMTIELTTDDTPDSGSGMPDLGHDAYWLKKVLPALEFKDSNGTVRSLEENYKILRVSTEIHS